MLAGYSEIQCSNCLMLEILVLEGAGYSLMLEIQCSYSLDPRKNGARPFATLFLKLGFE